MSEPIPQSKYEPQNNPAQRDGKGWPILGVLLFGLALALIAFLAMMIYWATDPSRLQQASELPLPLILDQIRHTG